MDGPTPVPAFPEPLRPGSFQALREMARESPVELIVRGSCMAPRLADGARVRIAAARLYWPGDVVAFQAPDGRLRLHRLLGYRPAPGGLACVTRGDHCPCHDDPVPLDRVLGRIVEPATPPLRRVAGRVRAVLAFAGLAARRVFSSSSA